MEKDTTISPHRYYTAGINIYKTAVEQSIWSTTPWETPPK